MPVIVLVTVNENETDAVLDAFVGEGKRPPTNALTIDLEPRTDMRLCRYSAKY
jgi:hypothetical protein